MEAHCLVPCPSPRSNSPSFPSLSHDHYIQKKAPNSNTQISLRATQKFEEGCRPPNTRPTKAQGKHHPPTPIISPTTPPLGTNTSTSPTPSHLRPSLSESNLAREIIRLASSRSQSNSNRGIFLGLRLGQGSLGMRLRLRRRGGGGGGVVAGGTD